MNCSRRWRKLAGIAPAIFMLVPAACWAITFPYADDFQDGTTKNWTNETDTAVTNQSGGPGGTADKFLQVSLGTFFGSPSLSTSNSDQWGDGSNYNVAGVGAIAMDLKYIAVGDPMADIQPIRIAIFDPGTFTGYSSTTGVPGGAVSLANDGAWHHWVFSLSDSALTAVGTPPPLSNQLSNVSQIRILSSATAGFDGDALNAQLGIDNITAVPTVTKGDFNRDTHFNAADIQAMAAALTDLSGYQSYWGLSNAQLVTLGNFTTPDTSVNNLDFQGLITALANGAGNGALSTVPEPASGLQAAVGALIVIGMGTVTAIRRQAQSSPVSCLIRCS
jgi:hypothetical protein